MKILHIVRSLSPGGLERVVIDLAGGLRGCGVGCHLACLQAPGEWFAPADWEGCWVWPSDRPRRVSGWIDLARYVREHRIDVIHSHNPQPHLAGVATHLLTGRPLVHTKHGRNYPGQWRRVWLNRMLARLTHRVVAVSDDAFAVARSIEKIPEYRMVCIRNGVQPVSWTDDQVARLRVGGRRRLGVSDAAIVIGSVGRLSPEKNYAALLKAVDRIMLRLPDTEIHLVLVGDGSERERLEDVARSAGIADRVHFAGMQSDPAPWYAAMDVFCLCSMTEGTSLTLLEAGSRGLPAVATDVGGNREVVIHGETGLVVTPGSVEALADALTDLIGSPEQRQIMGDTAGRHVRAYYSLETMVQQYMRVYGNSSGSRPKAGRLPE